ncbi:hypothetical protein SAMN05444392_10152 [Seinonella peptonophila]|uniref:Uncharacterized protein n=1 Tax=Seinonella peptonophila TaxID=112248 RepID=A0A1M4SMZ0_9BACL|nr:hypothetical protein [Seinonella peptonophila]SHE33539.1 hypothetical protein SAMN05444392_10152 [Seinonella peptonophila]
MAENDNHKPKKGTDGVAIDSEKHKRIMRALQGAIDGNPVSEATYKYTVGEGNTREVN